MNYEEALTYIEQLNSRGIALGLERIEGLLRLLGDPQDRLQCIHVAGTNGKGSVCAFMASALQKAGLRIGRYISPTLYEYRERFQINGDYIGEDDFAAILTEVQSACDQMAQQGQEVPTVFEVETAVAFLYFFQQKCDYVLLEVGMGGRLDSTNVIRKPVLSIITPISMDHTAMLGDTLEAIAVEKAGIIKNGCDVVLGPQLPEAMNVLMQTCKDCGVQPVETDESKIQQLQWELEGQHFHYGKWQEVCIRLLGNYQCSNAAIALDALQVMQKREPSLTDLVIREGLAEAAWPGRFTVVCPNPLVIVDGAHNPAGAQALADTIQNHFADKRIYLLMGVFRDKDYRSIAQIMSRCSDTIYCFQPQQERGLDADILAEAVKPFYQNTAACSSAEEAVKQAMIEAEQDIDNRMLVSFGSLSTIHEVQQIVCNIKRQKEVQHGTANDAE